MTSLSVQKIYNSTIATHTQCIPCIYGSVTEVQRMFGLEEGSHHHLLEPGNGGQFAKSNNSHKLAHVWTTASKLQEAGTVDRLWRERERERERERDRQRQGQREVKSVKRHFNQLLQQFVIIRTQQ